MGSYMSLVSAICALILLASFGIIVLGLPINWEICYNNADSFKIITREEWKARPPVEREVMSTPTAYVVIHHGGIPQYCHDQQSCSAIVRSYQNLHIDDRGWFDIGYSFVIGEDGNAYEGRGWDYVGAHAPGYNTQSIGICVIGDFSDFLPNEAALQALNGLIEYGVSLGKISKTYQVIGHRQVRNTVCPGEEFYKYVQTNPRWTANPVPIFTNATAKPVPVMNETSLNTIRNPPNIITRAQWGARSPKQPIPNLKINPAPYVVIHHSDTNNCQTEAVCKARVKSFQNYHMDANEWRDIGYNFLVGEDGNVYEGRGWGKHGAHSPPYNSRSMGICIIGNFTLSQPNAAAITTVQKLIDYGVSIGKIQGNYTLYGHRQTTSTKCPGDSLYNLIQSWPHWSSKK
ncbi:peptidoglycan recognition protein 3-like [Nomia melanderi]|uniref:peptidoglycan recognition protein 3-like n=1 Tax=Nomia melanderi TaxID=2448451 RepID=UPI003FCD61A3